MSVILSNLKFINILKFVAIDNISHSWRDQRNLQEFSHSLVFNSEHPLLTTN